MAEIRVGQQLREDGQKIQEMANTFSNILTEAYTLVESIDAGWEGLSNNAFMSDYERIKANLQTMPEMIKGFGDAAIQAADSYEQTDTAGAKR